MRPRITLAWKTDVSNNILIISNLQSKCALSSDCPGAFFPHRPTPQESRLGHRQVCRSASRLLTALLLAFITSSLPPANATTIYWDGSGTGWNSTGSWSTNSGATTPDPAAVPGIGDDVVFNITTVNAAQTVSLNANQAASSLLFRSAGTELLQAGGTNRTLTLGVGGITINSGAGAVTIGSGTAGQNVSVRLNGNETWTNNSSNTFTIQNGVSNVGNVTPFTLTVDGTGNATFNGIISNGGTTGTVAVTKNGTGTATLTANNTYTGGTTINGGTLTLDYSTNNTSKLANAAALNLGGGTLNLSGGSHTEVVGSTTLNTGASSVTRSSGTSVLRMNAITRNAGSTVNFGAASIADTDTSNVNGILGGYATVAGANWAMSATTANNTAITAFTTYTTFVATGGVATTNYLQTDAISLTASESANSLKINTTTTGQSLDIGATRTLTLTSGGLLFVGAQDYQINNGTLKSNTATNSDLIVQQWGAGTLTINSVIADGNGTSTLTKAGTGTLALGGNNTYSGTTFVNAGTLLANNATASTGSGAVQVNNSGTLGGTGKVTGAVTLNNSATIDGGTVGTVGTLSTGALTLNNTSILRVDMTGNPTPTADQISVTGAVTLASTALLKLDIPTNTEFAAGTSFTLINNDLADAISGTFSNAPAGSNDIIDGYAWIVTYTGGSGNDFVITAVPEPSTWLAAALALSAIGFSQRKRVRACVSSAVKKAFLISNFHSRAGSILSSGSLV